MKNSKGETLPHPYLALAEMRRAQDGRFLNEQLLVSAFDWVNTIESPVFWAEVNLDYNPAIPSASLAELEAWQKSKEQADWVKLDIDYKAMFNELQDAYKALEKEAEYNKAMYERLLELHEELQNVNQSLVMSQLTPTRNWVAECAMAAMQGMLSNSLVAGVIKTYNGLPHKDEICARAFDYAEAWAAEGRKRGHLPKTEKA